MQPYCSHRLWYFAWHSEAPIYLPGVENPNSGDTRYSEHHSKRLAHDCRKKIFTVLTSPHVNKDAREQFEIRTHSRLMDIKDLTPETIDRLMFLELPSGVNVEVKL